MAAPFAPFALTLERHPVACIIPLPRPTRTCTRHRGSEFCVQKRDQQQQSKKVQVSKLPPIHGRRLPMESYPDRNLKIFIDSWHQGVVVKLLSKLCSVCLSVSVSVFLCRASTWQLNYHSESVSLQSTHGAPPLPLPPRDSSDSFPKTHKQTVRMDNHIIIRPSDEEGNLTGETRSTRTRCPGPVEQSSLGGTSIG